MLIMVVPYQTSPQKQRVQVWLWTGVILIIYSVLVSLFKVKNRGVFPLLIPGHGLTLLQDILSNYYCNQSSLESLEEGIKMKLDLFHSIKMSFIMAMRPTGGYCSIKYVNKYRKENSRQHLTSQV